jgi:nickel-dependent lactate racemase
MSDAWVFSGEDRLKLPAVDHFEPPARTVAPQAIDWGVACAAAEPLRTLPLAQLARGAATAAITIPDASRPCPSRDILPPLLNELHAGGLPDAGIVIVVGCGLHRATTRAEKVALAGEHVAMRVEVVDAQAQEQESADLGSTALGTPILLNRRVAEADVVVTVGVVEPHLYAGFSGGVKGVAIGCAGEATIAWTHRPAFIDEAGVALGRLDGNPFQQTLRDIAARTRLSYAVNTVMNERGQAAAVLAGDPVAVQASLSAAHRAAWMRPVDGPFDVVVAGIHSPKHQSLYQASRAATYLALCDQPALSPGSLILLAAGLPDGAGDGPGERNFAAVLGSASPDEVIARGLAEPLGPGGQRAYVMAKVLRRYRVGVLGARDPGFLTPLGITAYESVQEALDDTRRRLGGRPRVLAVADAMNTVVHQS